jgi:hypothetical protein
MMRPAKPAVNGNFIDTAPSKVFAKRHGPEAKRTDAQTGTAKRDEGIERHSISWGCEGGDSEPATKA